MTIKAEVKLSEYLRHVDKLVEAAANAKEGQQAQQLAQAAYSLMQATHVRFLLIGSGHQYSFNE